MNYVFPIFCFGLVMTGIVFLGILEAAGQLRKDKAARKAELERDDKVPE